MVTTDTDTCRPTLHMDMVTDMVTDMVMVDTVLMEDMVMAQDLDTVDTV